MSILQKKISGEILARILAKLHLANSGELNPDLIAATISEEFDKADNIFCELEAPNLAGATINDYPRLACFDDQSYSKLDVMLPWSSYFYTGDAHSLGTPWSTRKRSEAQLFPDPNVESLNEKIPLKGLSILEVGCYEGHHTASLARYSKNVWAIDGRIENVIKTLVRTWISNCERKVNVNLIDLETNILAEALTKLGRETPFDLIHHRGVLYHLSHPIEHLKQCAKVCKRYLYLHTQIASQERANKDIVVDGKTYRVFEYKEPKVGFSPYSGITQFAYWLTEESLMKALADVGFKNVEVTLLQIERNGPRIELIASI